jgi:hypothetical protein
MTPAAAKVRVGEALLRVNPNAFGRKGRLGGVGMTITPNGDRFDILLVNTGTKATEYRQAIVTALGKYAGYIETTS